MRDFRPRRNWSFHCAPPRRGLYFGGVHYRDTYSMEHLYKRCPPPRPVSTPSTHRAMAACTVDFIELNPLFLPRALFQPSQFHSYSCRPQFKCVLRLSEARGLVIVRGEAAFQMKEDAFWSFPSGQKVPVNFRVPSASIYRFLFTPETILLCWMLKTWKKIYWSFAQSIFGLKNRHFLIHKWNRYISLMFLDVLIFFIVARADVILVHCSDQFDSKHHFNFYLFLAKIEFK